MATQPNEQPSLLRIFSLGDTPVWFDLTRSTYYKSLMPTAQQLVQAARKLRESVNRLTFSPPVTHVYNPLDYAWNAHELYLTKYANSSKRVVLLRMNPG